MTPDSAGTALPIDPPALSSPELSDVPDFVTQSGVSFGWSDGQFRVYKFKWSGGQAVLGRWPLGSDGWRLAWSYMRADHPELATQVLGACFRREEQLGAQADRATLADEHPIQVLRGWTLAAGQGWDPGLKVGDQVDVYFTEEAVTLTRAGAFRAYLRREYAAVNALEVHAGQGGDGPSGAVRFLFPESRSASRCTRWPRPNTRPSSCSNATAHP